MGVFGALYAFNIKMYKGWLGVHSIPIRRQHFLYLAAIFSKAFIVHKFVH
jgi:hypothetical protein